MKLLFKIFFIFCALFFLKTELFANHTKGGYFFYEYLGAGTANPSFNKYRVTLRVYMDVGSNPQQIQGNGMFFSYFDRSNNNALYVNRSVAIAGQENLANCATSNCYPCFTTVPSIQYLIVTFIDEVELPKNNNGYTISYVRCCRISGIVNIQAPSNSVGGTWSIDIPGQAAGVNADRNNSARFFNNDTSIVCKGNSFSIPFNAFDIDGDVLRYEFVSAFVGGDNGAGSAPTQAPPPPYGLISYSAGFSGSSPLGGSVTINPVTGFISGIAPPVNGEYVVTVLVSEIKNGVKIAEVRKEIHLKIGDCASADANLQPDYTTCDGFTLNFQNLSNSPLNQTFFWDFGVPGVTNDTSIAEFPTFTYADTGRYTIKLIVNKGGSCPDSTVMTVGVYPGFFPNFNTVGVCYTSPIQFNDASTTQYGFVDSWRWDFGDAASLADTSRLQNPQYTYPSPGPRQVQLIVTNSKGCIDTITKPIDLITKPTITLPFKDTLICSIDTLQLRSEVSSGNVVWTPNYRIINPTSNNPFVYPLVTTTYYIDVDDQGCKSKDSIKVNVVDYVTVDIMPDTAICLTDPVVLQTNSDALSYIWTPAATLNNATIQDPIATPVAAITKYYVSANIGKCQSRDSVTVIASPYPLVNVSADTTICFGDRAQIFGTATGLTYAWSPLNGLTNSNTLAPIAAPLTTTSYILSTQGAPGCNKPAFDTVVVTVIPKILANAGADTTVVAGQPLQLFATGSTNYLWSPASFLSNASVQNPIATLINNQTYVVRVSSVEGCFAFDTINIVVFKTAPDIFVPTAFTPNNDGKNDRLIPVPVGLKQYDFFEIYNRWGKRLYRTTQIKTGWDGTFGGIPQGIDTYVWQVQGTDYTGKKIFKKGTVVLIR